ncbi:LD-carboxypeptidase [Bacillus sonorensis]|uniref:Murein peptide carboxypeptidase YkfA n=2 Tax=Bacillus sonorensis TaxID=119858 RepID=M5PDE0_9BACI|nr:MULTISPECIES: LD-carboxypeptidase [Bacillus]TWK73032.1 putative murein peptide carboxypeptidase [Bacillus paralicheniformis]ASB89962.1 Muramoyltetrapeptide carboxypeptidase [Bacillus sonorensis]EME74635.1 murein peptide carboxypeptidase YkfA [Bacillus sonorensis L12]MBG9916821.1 peptidase S66 [Bacillus sonorensis]MCF7619212.1 LD-carboxypeptidase [Bacillus sonorensis]
MKIAPQKLKTGDTVGVIAPASPPVAEKLDAAVQYLKKLGLRVKIGRASGKKHGYLAGTDEERLRDFHDMFQDPSVKAVICACGGYGTGRIAEKIDFDVIKSHPKIFWGYSDITFLHMAIQKRTNLITFHGPMLSSDIGKEDVHPLTKQSFQQLFQKMSLTLTEDVSPLEAVVKGKAKGELIGGNLALLVTTLGTPFEIDTRGKLLFIEDIDEEPYKIDRMLNHLKMAGKLSDAAGILLCDFHDCIPKKRSESLTLKEIIEDYIVPEGKPALSGFQIGHSSPNIAIPIGAEGMLDTEKKQLMIEPGVS